MINKAKTLIISSHTLDNNGERAPNIQDYLPQAFLAANILFLYIYTTWTARLPVVMVMTHVLGVMMLAVMVWWPAL